MADQGYPIKVAVKRTGLSPHVIRVWEKRYGAVIPQRTATNRRLYTDADITRLRLLRQATLAGHSIGTIATLPTPDLRKLVAVDQAIEPPQPARPQPAPGNAAVHTHLETCIAAAEQLDATELEAALMRARVALSQPVFIEQLIVPLMHRIGDLWREGTFRIVHEHVASAVVRTILGSLLTLGASNGHAVPAIVVATPVGQRHEIGALLVASTAASEGWQVTYLGVNLPAEEIAAAAQQKHARAVALSIVHPADDPRLEHELTNLRRFLPSETSLIVGGRASEGYHDTLEAIGAVWLADMPSLRGHLERLRTGPGGTAQ
jgi:DNA-binding transcriptional MerR regulator/methylmalonyl-CoA mutase cobalamin-binding subunit